MSAGKRIGAGFVGVMAIIVAIAVQTQVTLRRLSEANHVVVHAHQVLERLERLVSLLKDAETGQRGFLLTGDLRYLEPYDAASGKIPIEFHAIAALSSNDDAQQQNLRRAQELVETKLVELEETIRLRQSSGSEASLNIVRTGRGKRIMDDFRALVDRMETRERQLLESRNTSAEAASARTLLTVSAVMPLALVAIAVAVAALLRNIRLVGSVPQPAAPGRKWPVVAATYLAAAALVAAPVLKPLGESLGPLPPFMIFYPVVLLAALLGGSGPGLLATALAALVSAYFYLPTVGHLGDERPGDVLALGIFITTNVGVSLLMERLQRARWAEAVGKAQEEQLALLYMGNLLSLDPNRRIVHWSEGSRRLYGFEPGEARGRLADELLVTRFPGSPEEIDQALLERGNWQGELTRRCKDGSELVVEILWALRRDARGRPCAILEVSTDLTQQRRDAMAIHRQSRELVRQNEAMRLQAEEIQALNAQQAHRTDLLQKLLDATRLEVGEESILRGLRGGHGHDRRACLRGSGLRETRRGTSYSRE